MLDGKSLKGRAMKITGIDQFLTRDVAADWAAAP